MSKTTILIESTTREKLREIGRKCQTYDKLINELIDTKKRSLLDSEGWSLRSSELSSS
jgi:hypothetical protein